MSNNMRLIEIMRHIRRGEIATASAKLMTLVEELDEMAADEEAWELSLTMQMSELDKKN